MNDGPDAPRRARDADATIEIPASDIDRGFVPVARADIATVELDGEMVLARLPEGTTRLQTFALNGTGTIVWQCFDGSGTLDEIAADLADAFGADPAVVGADVLALAQAAGDAGLLAGVREHVPEPVSEPHGVPAGLPLPSFEAEDEHGNHFSSGQLQGRRSVLVNWSPTCGFCERIIDQLRDVVPALADSGVDLVLLATGGAAANRALLDRTGLACDLLLQDHEIAEVFRNVGTPAAYVVDETGSVAEPMALGALDVPDLVRRVAGWPGAHEVS